MRSVAKISFGFYLAALAAFLVAVVVLWVVATAVGVVGSVEQFIDDLGFEGFRLLSGPLLFAAVLLGLAGVAILTIATVLAASLYNVFARLVGGVEVLVIGDEITAGSLPVASRANGQAGHASGAGSRNNGH